MFAWISSEPYKYIYLYQIFRYASEAGFSKTSLVCRPQNGNTDVQNKNKRVWMSYLLCMYVQKCVCAFIYTFIHTLIFVIKMYLVIFFLKGWVNTIINQWIVFFKEAYNKAIMRIKFITLNMLLSLKRKSMQNFTNSNTTICLIHQKENIYTVYIYIKTKMERGICQIFQVVLLGG